MSHSLCLLSHTSVQDKLSIENRDGALSGDSITDGRTDEFLLFF